MPPTTKTRFAEDLISRTAATLPPGPQKAALEHPGSPEYAQAMLMATMIEMSQQNPGPMSDKAKAHAEKLAADAKAAEEKLAADKAAQAKRT